MAMTQHEADGDANRQRHDLTDRPSLVGYCCPGLDLKR
jgi:hypothetical protein